MRRAKVKRKFWATFTLLFLLTFTLDSIKKAKNKICPKKIIVVEEKGAFHGKGFKIDKNK